MRTSLQLKFSISYILIIVGVLVLLNTYPLLVSQDLVFRSKTANMQSNVSVMLSSLSGLEKLTADNVAAAVSTTAKESGLSRVLVTDAAGKILYDTRESGNAAGQVIFYTEVVQALMGYDVSVCAFENGAFRSRSAAPVVYQNSVIGAVFAYEYDPEQAALLQELQDNIWLMSLIAAAAVVLLSVITSRAVTQQIRELLSAIRRVRAGSYSHRAPIRGHDEIAQIGEEFNRLANRLQKTEDTRRRFVSDASHELKTPLAAIRLLTDSILQADNIDLDMAREFVADIGHEAERLSRITEDLLLLTKLDSSVLPHADPEDVSVVLERVLRMSELLAEERGITIISQAEKDCRVRSTQDEIQQVIYNLVDNAVKYSRDWGRVEVSLRRDGDWVVLTVADNGVGIPVEDLPRIFERFYRVDKARSREAGGTGLGLAIVRETLNRRKATITAANRVEGGAIFTVCWPNAG